VQSAARIEELDNIRRPGVEDIEFRLGEDSAFIGGDDESVISCPELVERSVQGRRVAEVEIDAELVAAVDEPVEAIDVTVRRTDLRFDEEELRDPMRSERVVRGVGHEVNRSMI